MSNRRFPERSKQSTETSEAELAHKNLLAVNADLQRQLFMLEKSNSLRIGRMVLRLVQPIFSILRVKRFTNRSPDCKITSVWPKLSGTITIHTPTPELIPVKVWNSVEVLLEDALDPRSIIEGSGVGPWKGEFEFSYPLGFAAFDSSDLVARVGPTEFAGAQIDASGRRSSAFRPIDVAVDSVIEIRGDVERSLSRLREIGSVAIVSTYRSKDRVAAVPRRLVDDLRSQGFVVVIVDTSDRLSAIDIDSDLIIHRRNVGWDFASWMSTLAMFPWLIEDSQQLLLINDSNVGPLAPLTSIFERGRALDADIWGLTDSWDIAHHLQSYFLFFESSALRSGHLAEFVHAFTFPSVKERIIGSGEIGLSQFMSKRGLRLEALFPYSRLAETFVKSFPQRIERLLELPETRIQAQQSLLSDNDELNFLLDTMERIRTSAPVNPTHYFWDILLVEGFPFIKRDLLMKNPDRVSGLQYLPDLVRNESARACIDAELETWSRTHPDFSLPLALHWQPS